MSVICVHVVVHFDLNEYVYGIASRFNIVQRSRFSYSVSSGAISHTRRPLKNNKTVGRRTGKTWEHKSVNFATLISNSEKIERVYKKSHTNRFEKTIRYGKTVQIIKPQTVIYAVFFSVYLFIFYFRCRANNVKPGA